MKLAIMGGVVIVVVLFFVTPLLAEAAGTSCDAFEKQIVALASQATTHETTTDQQFRVAGGTVLSFLQGFSRGSFALIYVNQQYPHLPSGIGCTIEYWQTLFGLNPTLTAR